MNVINTLTGRTVQIGNLLIVGVIVSLDATADIKISAEADILAGVSLTIANFQANLDMVDRSKSGVSDRKNVV